jgi:pimeloyl-ACP methyl ester carboxylesterase
MARKKFGDVVVLLPGITGSVLAKEGKDVWAVSPGAAFSALLSLGRSLQDLRLGADDPTAPTLGDGVTAPRLVSDVHLIPGFWKIDGYSGIYERLSKDLTVDRGKNWFDFPYDWRRDNRAAAHRLAEQAPRWLAQWRQSSGNADAKLVLLAHSMGGLVARHYLEVLGGWQDTRHLLTFGTPYRGSINAVEFLSNGMKKGWGPLSVDLSELLRSMTSVYQLLPIYPSVRPSGGGLLARVAETDVPNIDRSRAQQALAFHRDIEAAQKSNADSDAYVNGGYTCSPLVGILQVTAQSATVRGNGVVASPDYNGADDGGDGTVPRVSATPIELSESPTETYAACIHGSLQGYGPILDHIVGRLTRKRLTSYRDTPFDGFRLEVPDLVRPDEPVPVRASTQGAAAGVRVTATDVDTGRVVRSRALRRRRDGTYHEELRPMPEGIYRVTVAPEDGGTMNPNTELLTVLAPESAQAGVPTRRR